ncbi:MAG TPA: hypothetical protein VF407_07140 [Polyangiaceae bacterium]
MRFLFAVVVSLVSSSIAVGACSSSSDSTNVADAGGGDAVGGDAASDSGFVQGTGGTSVGGGSITGASFSLNSVTLHDPGPFDGKARLEIALVDQPPCGRGPQCASYQELWLRVSSTAGGTIVPGTYTVILGDAGEVGSLEAKLETSTADGSSCNLDDAPAHSGTVTIDSVSATEAKGSFAVDIEDGTGTDHVTGTFDAKPCP